MPKALTPEEKMIKVEAKKEQEKATRVERKKRASFNGTEAKLRIGHSIDGYHLHIFNDEPGRIEQALSVGYSFVTPDEVGGTATNVVSRNTDVGDKVRFLVGTDGKGEALYAYLMKLSQEFYEEDQEELQRKNDLIDEAIRSGKLNKDGNTTEGFYTPKEGIKYRT